MLNFGTKANASAGPDSNTSTTQGAVAQNSINTENKNAVERAGLTLINEGSPDDSTQLPQSMFLHSVKAESMVASGTVNAIVLVPVSGSGGVLLPTDYANLDGANIEFLPTGPNGGAVTISIGQTVGAQLGTKKLFNVALADLAGGAIDGTRFVKAKFNAAADSAAGAWIITNAAAGASNVVGQTTVYTAVTGTAVSGNVIIANTSGGGFTFNLPASPSQSDYVSFEPEGDYVANTLTVGRNAQTIEGVAADLTITTNNRVVFRFNGTTWKVS